MSKENHRELFLEPDPHVPEIGLNWGLNGGRQGKIPLHQPDYTK